VCTRHFQYFLARFAQTVGKNFIRVPALLFTIQGTKMALWFVSLIASVTSVLSLAPQVIQTCRTKSVRTLSLLMLINFLICSISWVMYGYLTSTYFICVTNGITGTLDLILITLKLKYDFFEKKFI